MTPPPPPPPPQPPRPLARLLEHLPAPKAPAQLGCTRSGLRLGLGLGLGLGFGLGSGRSPHDSMIESESLATAGGASASPNPSHGLEVGPHGGKDAEEGSLLLMGDVGPFRGIRTGRRRWSAAACLALAILALCWLVALPYFLRYA